MPTPVFHNLPQAKQEAIVQAAVQEFAHYGYHQASINRMVNSLSIAKGSIFQYFGSKLGLFEHVFTHAKDVLSHHLRQVRDHTREQDFFQRIEIICRAGLEFIRTHPGLYRIYMHVLQDEHLPHRDRFLNQVRTASSAYLTGLVDQGIETGELRSDLSREWVILYVDALLDRFFQVVTQSGPGPHGLATDRATDRDHVQHLVRFLRCGLGPG